MPTEDLYLLQKGKQLFNGVYKDKFVNALQHKLGFWDGLKLKAGLGMYGDKFMPQIATKFGNAYKYHDGNMVQTLGELKDAAIHILKQHGLTNYEKPAMKAIDDLIDEESKRENAMIEYIDIYHNIHYSPSSNVHVLYNQHFMHLDHHKHVNTNQHVLTHAFIGFEMSTFIIFLTLFGLICIGLSYIICSFIIKHKYVSNNRNKHKTYLDSEF
eukprot:508950_1